MRMLLLHNRPDPAPGEAALASPRAPSPSPLATRLMQAVAVLYLMVLVACGGGGGCSGCGSGSAKIPGGYPIAERKENAVQVRATQGLFDFLGQNAKTLLGGVIPMGGIPVPSSCGGDTEICCNKTCSVNVELTGLNFTPAPPQTMKLVVRTKLKTSTPIPVKTKQGFITINCDLSFDSASSNPPDVGITANLVAAVNNETRLTSLNIDPNSLDILDLQDGDIKLGGNFGCDVLNLLKGLFLGTLKDQLKKQLGAPLGDALDGALCTACTDAKVDCPQFAAVTCGDSKNRKLCAKGGTCIQRIGVEQRLDASSLLSGFASGKPGNLDIYAVAGGYATVESGAGGLSLGMLGGARGTPQSSCVPARPAPGAMAPAPSPVYKGNKAPNGQDFHVGVGISSLELDLFGHGFYTSGGLCLNVGTAQVAQLSTSTLSALLPSLADLTRGTNSSVSLAIRPHQPPTFTLGRGTFKTDAMGKKTIDDPLLTVNIKDAALDFYLFMDDRNVRFMRLTTDLALPIGLDVDAKNQIVPVLGDLGKALGNLRVTDTALLKEDPAMLAALLPRLLPALLGSVSSSIAPIALPNFMGFSLTPVQITSTAGADANLAFLGLFLKLGIAPMMVAPDPITLAQSLPGLPGQSDGAATTLKLESLTVPPMRQYGLAAGAALRRPQVIVNVDATHSQGGALEWQYRIDQGMWRPFDTVRRLIIEDDALLLPGNHSVEVRSRIAGAPETLGAPARVDFLVAPLADDIAKTDNKAIAGGCSAAGGGDAGLPVVLGGVLLVLGLLARRGRVRAAAPALLLLAAGAAGCSKDDGPPAAPATSLFKDTDEIGRYLSSAASGDKLYLSGYNSTNGDLAFAVVSKTEDPIPWEVVDGLPEGSPDDTSSGAKRLGYTEAGPDVGRYTSLALAKDGRPFIAYQDVSNNAVKLAVLPSGGERKWAISAIANPPPGARLGAFTQLVLDGGDVPTVAYRAEGVQKDDGRVVSQLVVARAKTGSPGGSDDWELKVVEEADMSCAGLCGLGKSCVARTANMATTYVCTAASGTCNPGCGSGKLCVANACTDIIPAGAAGPGQGTGLYNRLVSDGQTATLLFYNRAAGALKLAQGPDWKVTVVDGGMGQDAGAYPGAALAADGTLHIAYGGAGGESLLYRTWKGGTLGKVETADSGARGAAPNVENHTIGANATVFLGADGAPQVVYQDQTAGTMELAGRQSNGTWSVSTKATGNTQSRGYYAQAVKVADRWLLLDVLYDHMRDEPLSNVAITPLQ